MSCIHSFVFLFSLAVSFCCTWFRCEKYNNSLRHIYLSLGGLCGMTNTQRINILHCNHSCEFFFPLLSYLICASFASAYIYSIFMSISYALAKPSEGTHKLVYDLSFSLFLSIYAGCLNDGWLIYFAFDVRLSFQAKRVDWREIVWMC